MSLTYAAVAGEGKKSAPLDKKKKKTRCSVKSGAVRISVLGSLIHKYRMPVSHSSEHVLRSGARMYSNFEPVKVNANEGMVSVSVH